MTSEEIRNRMHELMTMTLTVKETLKDEYEWEDNDSRIVIFALLNNAIEPAFFSRVFSDLKMKTDEFWRSCGADPSDESIKINIDNYDNHITINLVQNFTYCMESALRIISRQVQPEKCSNGTAEFRGIYVSLLNLAGLKSKYSPLYDLFRNLRNAMHNNNVYYHRSGDDLPLEYKGKTYLFENGKPVEIKDEGGYIKLVLDLIEDLIDALKEFVESENIRKYNFIKHEWTTSERKSYHRRDSE